MNSTWLSLLLVMWACSGERGAPPAASDGAPVTPPGLHEEATVLDPTRNRLVLFGGMYADSAAGGGYANLPDTYEWADGHWSRRPQMDTAPSPRALGVLEFDPRSGRVNLFGGVARAAHGEPGSVRPCPSCPSIKGLSDRWEYDGSKWTPKGTIPSVSAPRVVFDSRRQEMLLIGSRGEFLGVDGAHRVLLWREAANGTWVLADTTGPQLDAPPRAAFDPMRGVLVVPVLQGPDAGVWEWSDGWRRVTAAGPSPRERFVMTYDESRRAMVIFGGRTDEQHYLNDLWSWDGTRWQSINSDSASAPSPRSDGSLFYEPRSRRLILIGGLGPGDVLHRETWVSVNATWSRLQ